MKEKLYIIKVGTTFPEIRHQYGDFDQWTAKSLGTTDLHIVIVDVEKGETLPPAKNCAGIIITGSHAMVTENLDWSVRVEKWISMLLAAQVPLFGICYGHQLLARAEGGIVGFHTQGMEIGTVAVTLENTCTKDPLFGSLPKKFWVHTSHSQTVSQLPPGALPLAGNDFEPNHAFRLGTCAWGVQFHPEYTPDIMQAYIDQLSNQGLFGRQLSNSMIMAKDILVTHTPYAEKLLREFGCFVQARL